MAADVKFQEPAKTNLSHLMTSIGSCSYNSLKKTFMPVDENDKFEGETVGIKKFKGTIALFYLCKFDCCNFIEIYCAPILLGVSGHICSLYRGLIWSFVTYGK